MDADFLSPVSVSYRKNETALPQTATKKIQTEKAGVFIKSPEEALEIIRNEPSYESLRTVICYLSRSKVQRVQGPSVFSIAQPSPESAQLVQVLVTEIAPNYWALLKEDSHDSVGLKDGKRCDLEVFLDCLRSLTGVNAILIHLRALIRDVKSENKELKGPHASLGLRLSLELITGLLQGDGCVQQIWTSSTAALCDPAKMKPISQDLLNVLGGGRIVSLCAEAEQLMRQENKVNQESRFWTADGLEYTTWLGRNITAWIEQDPPDEQVEFCSALFGKSLRLGHFERLSDLILQRLLLRKGCKPHRFSSLFSFLPRTEQRKLVYSFLKALAVTHLNKLGNGEQAGSQEIISAVASVVHSISESSETVRADLIEWLTNSSGAGLGDEIGIRRATIRSLSQDNDSILQVLEKSIRQFGDLLYVKHAPIMQQEAHAQVLLLSAGYVHRTSPSKLTVLMKSSEWLSTISNRIGASQDRARFLGMVVGEALSALVDKGEKKLDFHMEETSTDEGLWYKHLTQVSDGIGSPDLLHLQEQVSNPTPKETKQTQVAKKTAPQTRVNRPPKQGFVIEEVDDDDDDDEDDIVPYAKPDSDPEDSDEDATLVRRDKPKAAVYVRDLIRQLRDTENYDHQKLALETAPLLIRRKARHGTEVSEHAEEVASLLVGLQNKFDLDDFENLRIQGMVAVIVAQPKTMGTWFAKTFFDGDYSINQRASILVVLGLSAREIAGFEDSKYTDAASFPSKRLPERVEQLFLKADAANAALPRSSNLKPLPPTALETMAQDLASTFLAPMAANAADAATGPDVLKLSTFKSRLQDQQTNPNVTRKSRAKPRVRAIPNTTAQLISSGFFFPLTARFQAALHSRAARVRGVVFQPTILGLYIKTLGVLLHSAGPSTLALPQMTTELWSLVLSTSVRAQCVGDLGVTGAVLFSLLTLLELNEDRMRDICQDMSREFVETQEWVAGIFEGIRGDDGGEENQVKMMAAGVLIRLKEGMEKYRLLMVGDLI